MKLEEIRESIELLKRTNAYLERTRRKYEVLNHFRTNEIAIEALERIEMMMENKGYYVVKSIDYDEVHVTWVDLPEEYWREKK